MNCCRQYRVAFIVAVLAVVGGSAAWAAPVKNVEVFSPRTFTARVNGQIRTMRDLCVSGQCLIQLAPTVTPDRFNAMLKRQRGQVLRAFGHYNMFLVSLPKGLRVRAGVERWQQEPGVIMAEPNRTFWMALEPNDPLYPRQYHWPRVNAPEGWDMTTGSQEIVVAVIDSGMDMDHEDLASRVWINADEIPGNGTDDDGNGYPDDVNGWDFIEDDGDPTPHPTDPVGQFGANHGSHVAGLIGAATNNATGVAGHDWECRLMTLRVFDEDGGGCTTDVVIAAIDYAVDNGAHVINMSIASLYTRALDAPLQRARQNGVVVVAAAGNESHEFTDDPTTWESPVCNDGSNPAEDNWVLGVAATDENDVKADFSNYDGSSTKTFVDVCAPGVNILSCYIYDPANGFDQPYGPMDGTSMACPIVAGLVALVRASEAGLSPLEVINKIKDTCDNIDELNPPYAGELGAGRINTAEAIGMDLPPGPPRAVIAADTPNDEGGSITVTWSKSVDDGRGKNDVTHYVVYRCGNTKDENGMDVPDENWTVMATVPAGELTMFVDAPVPDHVPYWYKVTACDAKNEVAAPPAGPAEARDDLAPPAVEGLVAADTQADDGGSISLSWRRYAPPDDFQGFRVYRAQHAFSRPSDAQMIADLPGDASITFYQDTAVEDGVEYWYAVTAYDDENNEVTQVESCGPVVSSPNLMLSLPAGVSMIAIGAETEETDMAKLLGLDAETLKLARWDPVVEAYRTYQANPNDPFLQQAPGRGFWLRLDEPLMLNIAGQPIETETFTISLAAGWNQLGNPFASDLRWQGVKVAARGTEFTLAQSNMAGITADYAWTWDPYSRSYRLVTEYEGFGDKTVGEARGFWFLAYESCQLILPSGVQAAAAKRPKSVNVQWKLRLVARCHGMVDSDNYLGVSPQAGRLNGIVSPPAPMQTVDLYFLNEGVAGRAAASFVKPGKRARWSICVACAAAGGATVELLWPDLSDLPKDVRPVLIDKTSGRRVYMRTVPGYRFRPGKSEAERRFEIVLAGQQALAVQALAARPAGAGAEICFTLSAPASVSVEIINIAGHSIRQVVGRRQMQAGPCRVVWNGCGDSGSPAPPGRYIVKVTARADNGQQVTAVRTLVLRR